MKHLIIALTLLGMGMPAFAGTENKVDICHFDLDYGVWKLISISGNAVEGHFENHDDGLPESDTLGTGTPLDSSCEVANACPCFTQQELSALEFDGGLVCQHYTGEYTSVGETYDSLDSASATADVYFSVPRNPVSFCTYGYWDYTLSGDPALDGKSVLDISQDEAASCAALLLDEMGDRGCEILGNQP